MKGALSLALALSFFGSSEVACQAPPPVGRAEVVPSAESPFEGTLAFQSDREGSWDVFVVEAGGSGWKRLTHDPAHDMNPAWSPDGDRLAFASERTGKGDIYIMSADGTAVRRLTDHPEYEGAPSWSPDGRWIAFEAERDGRSEIYRVEVETGRVERMTDSLTRKLGPAWAPDGSRLAFMEKGLIRWQITLMDLADPATRVLTSGGGNCRPAWSPDGHLLALVSTEDTPKAEVTLMDMERGASWRVLTRPSAHNYDPSFSPDGLAIALSSTRERDPEDWDLFLADVNGRRLVQLTSGEANDRFPDWRPEPSGE